MVVCIKFVFINKFVFIKFNIFIYYMYMENLITFYKIRVVLNEQLIENYYCVYKMIY